MRQSSRPASFAERDPVQVPRADYAAQGSVQRKNMDETSERTVRPWYRGELLCSFAATFPRRPRSRSSAPDGAVKKTVLSCARTQ